MTAATEARIPSVSWLTGCAVSGRTAAFLLCCVSAAIGRPALADPARDRAAIIDAMQSWERAVEARDYETLETFYTEDAIFYPNNAGPVVGRAAILERNRQRGSDAVVDIRQQVDDISINGNWAVYSCVARIEVSTPGTQEKAVRHARVLLVMEKDEAGRWRIHRDIDNDLPEQPETE
jgi:uncharacterized protein (TIGR02246 family)